MGCVAECRICKPARTSSPHVRRACPQEDWAPPDAVAWLVGGEAAVALDGKAWAGAAHWRFRSATQRAAAAAAAADQGAETGPAAPR
jgi:hypothetical protein